jgi:hypothetical protein
VADGRVADQTVHPQAIQQLVLPHDSIAMLDQIDQQVEDLRFDVQGRAVAA